MKANVIILNYNGETLIPQCLPSIIEAKHSSKNEVRITVIDNESTDNSLNVLAKYSEEIDVEKMKNRVLCSFNDVVKEQVEEIAILLNNDIKVDKDFIDPLINVFKENEDAFLSGPLCYDFEGKIPEGGKAIGFIKFGWFGAIAKYKGWEDKINEPDYTFQSGFGAVSKDKFVELGGYDDLYLPGRLEDSDICFRAWKKGWKCFYQPKSVVYHMGGVSFNKKFGKNGVSSIDSCNSLLFFWKNISDSSLWLEHVLFLPLRIVMWILCGRISTVKGVFRAFSKIGDIKKRRSKKRSAISDKDIFGVFK